MVPSSPTLATVWPSGLKVAHPAVVRVDRDAPTARSPFVDAVPIGATVLPAPPNPSDPKLTGDRPPTLLRSLGEALDLERHSFNYACNGLSRNDPHQFKSGLFQ
ncbi:hypothetical protein R6H26_13720 [Altericista sp. CCNU0014]